jgi:hypothetical protein
VCRNCRSCLVDWFSLRQQQFDTEEREDRGGDPRDSRVREKGQKRPERPGNAALHDEGSARADKYGQGWIARGKKQDRVEGFVS